MMLLLGYLLRAHYKWRNAQVEVMTVVQKESRIPEVKMALQLVLDNARLDAEPKVLVQGDESIPALMERESKNADLVVLGMNLPGESTEDDAYMRKNGDFLSRLPSTVLVRSGRDFEGEPVLLDENE